MLLFKPRAVIAPESQEGLKREGAAGALGGDSTMHPESQEGLKPRVNLHHLHEPPSQPESQEGLKLIARRSDAPLWNSSSSRISRRVETSQIGDVSVALLTLPESQEGLKLNNEYALTPPSVSPPESQEGLKLQNSVGGQ